MAEDKKEKKDKESPQSWWGLGTLAIALILIIGAWLAWPAKKPQRLVSAQPAVVEKTCPEDLAKCEPCEGVKNFEWPLDKKGKPLPQLVVDVSATNCTTGYVITPRTAPFVYTYHETDQYVQFQDGAIFLNGPAKVVNYGDERRAIIRFVAKDKPGKARIELDNKRRIF